MPGAAAPTRLRARALYCAAVLADIQADPDAAERLSREACDIYRQLDDIQGVATTMTVMAFQAQRRGRYDECDRALRRDGGALGAARRRDRRRSRDEQHGERGQGRRATSTSRVACSSSVVASSQSRGDVRGFASALNGLGDVAAAQGDHDAARRYHHESLAKYREIDDRWGIARVLSDLADVDLQAGDYDEAESSLREALQAFRALGHQRGVARQLEVAGVVRRLPVARRRGGAAGERGGGDPPARRRAGASRRARDASSARWRRPRQRLSAEALRARPGRTGARAPLDRLLGLRGGRAASR